ncbi:MAG: hemolysin family protein, partial [Acidobacteriota bacterium]
MILFLTILALLMALLVTLVTCIQVLYLESLRIRSRELPSLEYFKAFIQPKIGLEIEQGALAFSLVKHAGMGILGCLLLAITSQNTSMWEALAGACLLSSLIAIISAHVVPQLIYHKSSGQRLMVFVPVLKLVALLVRPLSWTVEFLHSLFGLDGGQPTEDSQHAEEPIEALINAGEEEGIIHADDRELIQSAVAFGDKTVREVLTPRPRIVSISADTSLEDLRDLAKAEQYSRIPAYDGDIDSVVGFVHVRDMFELDEKERARRTVRDILRPIRTVPESKPVTDLLREMQEEGAHMAVVVDEYGSTAGIVTMEDMVEEIVGEIHDEHEPERDIQEGPDGSYVVSGSFDVDRLRELLDFQPPEGTESTTVGGLVTEWLGHVPKAGEDVGRDGIMIKVLAANDMRVDKVRVQRA